MDRTIPIELEVGWASGKPPAMLGPDGKRRLGRDGKPLPDPPMPTLVGLLEVIGGVGVVSCNQCPRGWDMIGGGEALRSAVLDGRIKVDDDVHVALDLSGAEPKVR